MRPAPELPMDVLSGRLLPPEVPEDTAAGSQVARVAQIADRGDHDAAAREAASLIEAGLPDVRLIGFYLFGVFLARGVGALPALLGRTHGLLTTDLAALRPTRHKLRVVNSATAWLFEHISARVSFHTKQRDAVWEAWRGAGAPALADEIVAGCTKVTQALEAAIDAPLAAVPLARLRRWANEDLRRTLTLRQAAAERVSAAATATAPPVVAPPDAPAAAADVPPVTPAPPDAPAEAFDAADDDPPAEAYDADPPVEAYDADPVDPPAGAAAAPSPPLVALQTKLRGFQELVARGDLAKAAIVAADVRATIDHFDPIAFFPALFVGYFRALHQVIDELTPYLERVGDPAWDALASYYRADMDGFFES